MRSQPDFLHMKVHPNPIWRGRSNFIIAAKLDEPGYGEQLWARRLEPRKFEICCIPFYVYDLALGDHVVTNADYQLVTVVKPSGRYVFRVWFSGDFQDEVLKELDRQGALVEWHSSRLLGVDAADQEHAELVASLLSRHESQQRLTFETGRR